MGCCRSFAELQSAGTCEPPYCPRARYPLCVDRMQREYSMFLLDASWSVLSVGISNWTLPTKAPLSRLQSLILRQAAYKFIILSSLTQE